MFVYADAKVICVGHLVKVLGRIMKQDATIADSISAAKITLWEANVDSVTQGKLYQFASVVMCRY